MINQDNLVSGKYIIDNPSMTGVTGNPYPETQDNVIAHFIGFVKRSPNGEYSTCCSYGYDGVYYDGRKIAESEVREYEDHCNKIIEDYRPAISSELNKIRDSFFEIKNNLLTIQPSI